MSITVSLQDESGQRLGEGMAIVGRAATNAPWPLQRLQAFPTCSAGMSKGVQP